jgi:hypothetical protein
VLVGYDRRFFERDLASGAVPAEVQPFFYASFERLAHGHQGCQLPEFGADGALLDSWSAGQRISSLQACCRSDAALALS